METATSGGLKYFVPQFYRREFGIIRGHERDHGNEKWRKE
jgi:hypothetical protein